MYHQLIMTLGYLSLINYDPLTTALNFIRVKCDGDGQGSSLGCGVAQEGAAYLRLRRSSDSIASVGCTLQSDRVRVPARQNSTEALY